MTSAETGRRAGRREVRRWRILSALALALIGIALFWHRQFLPPPTALILPPYPVPAVAHQVLTTTELPALPAAAGGWLPMQDGPPTTGVWVGSGRFRADVRNELFVGAWQRTWVSTDGQDIMEVVAYETRARAGAVSFLPSQCKPQQQARLAGATAAGYVLKSQQAAEACAAGLRGRTVLAVTVWANGSGASDFAWQALREGLGRELPKVPATAKDLPAVSVLSSPTRIAILSTLMGVVLGIPLLLGLITVARDRSTWRRLRSRVSLSGFLLKALGAKRDMAAFPVDRVVNVRLARHAALVLIRIAVITWTMRATEAWHYGMYQTEGALAVVIAAILAVEWLVRRHRPAPWRPAIFAGSRWLIGAASLLVSAVLAGAGIYLVVAGAMFSSLDILPGESDFLALQFGRTGEVAGALLILGALLPFTLARRLGMRALRNQAGKQHSGDVRRHPVLMLRSFTDDRRLLRARRFDRASIVERLSMRRFERFDEVAASALAVHGPVLAVSPPGERLPPPLGAERRSFANDDWQDRIRELIGASRLICVTVGRSESLLWEIGQIRAAGALDRAVFLLPPTGKPEQRKRLMVLAYALGVSYDVLDQTRPERDVLAVVFPSATRGGGVPVVITGAAQDDVGYETAISAWALTLTEDHRGFPPDLQRLSAELDQYANSGAAAAAAARVRPIGSAAASRPDPRRLIYAPGKAPAYKPWSRRMVGKHMLGWTMSILVIPVALKLLGGNAVPTESVHANYSVTTLVQDEASPAVYAVLDGRLIQQLDFKNPDSHQAIAVHDFITGLVVDGSSAYYTSRGTGHVGRIDLRTGHLLWAHKVGVGVESAVLANGRIVVASPATGSVEELSATDGHLVTQREMAGTPYSVTAADGWLYVTLARKNQVAELDAKTLQLVMVVKVPSGPRDIYAQGSQVWVQCDLAHELVAFSASHSPARPTYQLWTSIQAGGVSSAAGWLSIEGQEWVSLVSPGHILTRIPLGLPHITSMVVQPDASVIVGYENGDIDKLGPIKS
jgi:hypothetical protein